MSETTRPDKPCYYRRDGDSYVPTGLARSPWDARALAGGPISALLGHGAEDRELEEGFEVARFTVDIFGKVPNEPLRLVREPLREGRQTLLHRITIVAGDRPAAQAHALRVRKLETPAFPIPCDYPAPEDVAPFMPERAGFTMAGAVTMRPVSGGPGRPGRAVAWLHMNGEVVSGTAPSGFVKACMFGDFGNGFGAVTDPRQWSYANLDITIQFLRMPRGDWFLLDADTHMAGNGHGTARSVFADRDGVYARGFQTIFVAPGHESKSVPPFAGKRKD